MIYLNYNNQDFLQQHLGHLEVLLRHRHPLHLLNLPRLERLLRLGHLEHLGAPEVLSLHLMVLAAQYPPEYLEVLLRHRHPLRLLNLSHLEHLEVLLHPRHPRHPLRLERLEHLEVPVVQQLEKMNPHPELLPQGLRGYDEPQEKLRQQHLQILYYH